MTMDFVRVITRDEWQLSAENALEHPNSSNGTFIVVSFDGVDSMCVFYTTADLTNIVADSSETHSLYRNLSFLMKGDEGLLNISQDIAVLTPPRYVGGHTFHRLSVIMAF